MSDVDLKSRIEGDLKKAMIARDKSLVSILRSLKSAILYKEVADGVREQGLEEPSVVAVLKKEKKSRQDAFDMYKDAGESERAEEEQYQMEVIASYLPEELSEADAKALVAGILSDEGIEKVEMKHMGVVMGKVKASGAQVDGAVISKIIKEMIAG